MREGKRQREDGKHETQNKNMYTLRSQIFGLLLECECHSERNGACNKYYTHIEHKRTHTHSMPINEHGMLCDRWESYAKIFLAVYGRHCRGRRCWCNELVRFQYTISFCLSLLLSRSFSSTSLYYTLLLLFITFTPGQDSTARMDNLFGVLCFVSFHFILFFSLVLHFCCLPFAFHFIFDGM